ncbi:hypothetical protein D3C78_723650 [compost metagenome]
MDEAVHRLPAVAQFLQGADAEAAEGEDAARLQYAAGLAEHGGEVRAPLHRQAGEDQLLGPAGQRQVLGIAGDETLGAAQRAGVAQHAFGDIQRQAFGGREAFGQGAGEMPGAAAHIEPVLRREAVRQAAQQFVADGALQGGDAVVAVRRAGEGSRHLALVRQMALCFDGDPWIRHRHPRA